MIDSKSMFDDDDDDDDYDGYDYDDDIELTAGGEKIRRRSHPSAIDDTEDYGYSSWMVFSRVLCCIMIIGEGWG